MDFTHFVSKEASLADWIGSIATASVVMIALWDRIKSFFSRWLFPKINPEVSGAANLVISMDGKIHKLQIPYQIVNKNDSTGYIESMQLILEGHSRKYILPWRKFVTDFAGSQTTPISNTYRFSLGPNEALHKFVEFLTEENIQLQKGTYQVTTLIEVSYGDKRREIHARHYLAITSKTLAEVAKNSDIAQKKKIPLLIGGIELISQK